MKKLLFILFTVTVSLNSFSADITGVANYSGKIKGVGMGFYDHVGVGLPPGETCHGLNAVILLNSEPAYKEMLTVLLAAEAANKEVNMYMLGAYTHAGDWCLIKAVSLGDFPLW